MKTAFYYFIILATTLACSQPCPEMEDISNQEVIKPVGFDSLKANELGADPYGMSPYVIAFLKTGPNQPKDSAHAAQLQAAHMANIGRLADAGLLVLAGPFYGESKGDFRGLYVFNTSSIDSAQALTKSDPAIVYGSLTMELKQWYGSAAVKAVNDIHKVIAEVEI